MRIGVYVCECGINIAATVDVKKVAEHAKHLPNVVASRFYKYMCSDPGQELIKKDIKELKLDRVVVASCSPRMHEPTFRAVLEKMKLNAYCLEMVNIREQCSWVHKNRENATDKAKALVQSSVFKVGLLKPLDKKKVGVTPAALVVGGGIAGIQAAIDIGNMGFKTYLVEKTPSIGGRMAQLDKTFPTMDCSACILTPKMVDVARHCNVDILTYSEIESIEGYVGNFKVKVNKKPRFVDPEKCTACNDCVEICPVSVPNEFDMDIGMRKAIYIPFPQAVPQKYTIDKIGIAPCVDECPAGVNAQGYIALISQGKFKEALALEREENPFASVCGRVCTHPCEGKCSRAEYDEPVSIRSLKRFIADQETKLEKPDLPKKKKEKIAVVGSGPAGLTCAYYLAREGYIVKVFESLPIVGGMLAVGIPNFRLPRDQLKRDIDYIKSWGVEIETNKTLGEDFTVDDLFKKGYKSVFLGIGAHKEQKLNIHGENLSGVYSCVEFLRKVNLDQPEKIGKRVAVIGGGNAAVDAARTALRLGADEVSIVYRRSRIEMPADEEEIEAAEEEGIKIIYLAAPVKILGEGGKVYGIECIKMQLGPPDESGRRRPVPVKDSEYIMRVDNVIPAISQLPDLYWLKNPDEIKKTDWKTILIDPITFETSKKGVFAAGDAVTGPGVIIGAIAQGKETAMSIDRYLRGKNLKIGIDKKIVVAPTPDMEVEKQPRARMQKLHLNKRKHSFKEIELGFNEKTAIEEAKRCLNCNICSLCKQCEIACEAEAIDHDMKEELLDLDVGAIVVATGYDLFDPLTKPDYGYGTFDNVITGLEFERIVSSSGPTEGHIEINGKEPKKVVFIQCVGSRDKEGNEYCSRVCCMYTAKQAHMVRDKIPDAELVVYYTDVRAFGKGFEEFYNRVLGEDINYRRRELDDPINVEKKGDKAVVKAKGHPDIEADLVVLATGLVPKEDAKELARVLNINQSADGFFLEAHPKLRPMDTFTDGIFLAGCCQSPKDVPDAVAQASGAASRVCNILSKKQLEIEATIAHVEKDLCRGCGFCVDVCPYTAIELKEIERFGHKVLVASVNEALCKGCGSCSAACLNGAIGHLGFTDGQILTMIKALGS